MSASTFKVTVDLTADAAYVRISDEPVMTTKEVSDEVLVDLDAFNVVVGVEFLRIDADLPFQRLIDEFHVHSTDVELLRSLRPSIAGRLSMGSDGATSATRENVPQPA